MIVVVSVNHPGQWGAGYGRAIIITNFFLTLPSKHYYKKKKCGAVH
jgi:hypothetical protein